MSGRDIKPVHPGELLLDDINEIDMSQNELARRIGVTPSKVNEIVRGRRGITADTSRRLGKLFNQSEEFWLNLQKHYELEVERDRIEDFEDIKPLVLNTVPANG